MLKKKVENFIWVYLGSAAAFFYSLIFSKVMHIEQYADFIITISFAAFSQILVNYGSDKVLLKSLVANKNNKLEIILFDLFFRCLLFFSISIIFYYFVGNIIVPIFIWYTLNALFPKSIAEDNGNILFQNKAFGTEKLFSLIFIFVYSVNFEVEKDCEFVIFLIMTRIFSICYQYYYLCRDIFNKPLTEITINKSSLKEHFLNSGFVMMALFFNAILLYGSQIILKDYSEPSSVAIVGLGLQLCLIVQIFQSQLIRFYNKDLFYQDKHSKESVLAKVRGVIIPSLILVTCMNVVSYLLENYYLGEKFRGIYYFSLMISPWLIVLGPASLISQLFLSIYSSKYYLSICFLSSFISLVLSFLLIPEYKEYGYLMQLYWSHITAITVQFVLVWRKLNNDNSINTQVL